MKNRRQFWATLIALGLSLGLMTAGSHAQIAPIPAEPQLAFEFISCQGRDWPLEPDTNPTPKSCAAKSSPIRSSTVDLSLEVRDRTLWFRHGFYHNCCFQFAVEGQLRRRNIQIIERRSGGTVCRCMCTHEMAGSFGELLPGRYTVEIFVEWGDELRQVAEEQIFVNP